MKILRGEQILSDVKGIHSEIKNKCSWVQYLTGRRPMRIFSPEAVATIALWKSAPGSETQRLRIWPFQVL